MRVASYLVGLESMHGGDTKSGPGKDRECRFKLHLHVECNSAGLPGRLEVRSWGWVSSSKQ
jgi:hypothetical protein